MGLSGVQNPADGESATTGRYSVLEVAGELFQIRLTPLTAVIINDCQQTYRQGDTIL